MSLKKSVISLAAASTLLAGVATAGAKLDAGLADYQKAAPVPVSEQRLSYGTLFSGFMKVLPFGNHADQWFPEGLLVYSVPPVTLHQEMHLFQDSPREEPTIVGMVRYCHNAEFFWIIENRTVVSQKKCCNR